LNGQSSDYRLATDLPDPVPAERRTSDVLDALRNDR